MSEPGPEQAAQRIDKWLWHARFARTRAAAQRLALSGHVRVNRDKVVAASRLVRQGDVLTLALGRGVRVIRVCAIAERRGSFEEAQRLYADQITDASAAGETGDPGPAE
jgi:ribosome-associated heat shock protein Hsp15